MARIPVYEAQQGLETDRGGMPRYQPLDDAAQALGQLGNTIQDIGLSVMSKEKAAADKAAAEKRNFDDFKTRLSFTQLQNDIEADQVKMQESMPETGEGFSKGFNDHVKAKFAEFEKTVPPELLPEYQARLGVASKQYENIGNDVERKARQNFQRTGLTTQSEQITNKVAATPENWRAGVTALNDLIDTTDLPDIEKEKLKRSTEKLMFDAALAGYKEQGRFDDARKAVDDRHGVVKYDPAKAGEVASSLADGIKATAASLGIPPLALATAISYETAGTFNPTKLGPRTQHGQHRGLIQFGEPQARQFGVDWNNPIASQLGPDGAIAKYLKAAGVKPGMGLMEIYSAINAGRVGRNNASDANNGGAPGTVADKVNNQMAGHKAKAKALLGGDESAVSEVTMVTKGSFTDREAALADIDQEEKKFITLQTAQQTADYKGRLNALLLDVSEGRAGEADILEARKGWLSDFEDLKKVNTAREQYVKDQEEQSGVADRLANGGFINPADKKDRDGIDKLFKNAGSSDDVMGGKPQTVQAMYGLFDQTGIVPERAKDAIHAMLASVDGAKITTALSYLSEFERRNPRAFRREFTEADERAMIDYRSKSDYATPEQIAKEFTQSRDVVTEEVRKTREKDAEKQVKDLELGDVTDLFDKSYLPLDEPGMVDQGAADALLNDYKKLLVEDYKATGDMDKAKVSAAQRITRIWGASVAAGGRVMKFPPENYYPMVKGGFDWMKSTIEEDLIARGLARKVERTVGAGKVFGKSSAMSVLPYYVVPDEQTRADISGQKPPSYQVWVQDENGVFDVVRDKAGGVLRYMWNAKPSADKARAEMSVEQSQNATAEAAGRQVVDERMKQLEQSINTPLLQGAQ